MRLQTTGNGQNLGMGRIEPIKVFFSRGFKGKIIIHLPLCEYWKILFEVLNQTCKSEHHFLFNKRGSLRFLTTWSFYSTAYPKSLIRQCIDYTYVHTLMLHLDWFTFFTVCPFSDWTFPSTKQGSHKGFKKHNLTEITVIYGVDSS